MSQQTIVYCGNNYQIDSNVQFWAQWNTKINDSTSKWYRIDLNKSLAKYNEKPQNCAIVLHTMNGHNLSLADFVEWQVCIYIYLETF